MGPGMINFMGMGAGNRPVAGLRTPSNLIYTAGLILAHCAGLGIEDRTPPHAHPFVTQGVHMVTYAGLVTLAH